MKKLLAVVAACAAVGVQAGTYYVDANAAEGGTGTSWGDAFNSLGAALEVATGEGDEILLAGNDLTPEATFTIANHPGLTIRGGYTGEDTVTRTGRTRIVGNLTFRIFEISASTVTFDGVSIEKGHKYVKGGLGHGVQLLNMDGCTATFTNCLLNANGKNEGENGGATYGGAIAIQNGTLNVVDCEFTANLVSYSANNFTAQGAGIYASGANVSMRSSRFDRNYCLDGWRGTTRGGAVSLVQCPTVSIDSCLFTTNYIERRGGLGAERDQGFGGALALTTCPQATITGCSFFGNRNNKAYKDSVASLLQLGGGHSCYFSGSTVSMTRTVFSGDGVGNAAGAIGNGAVDVYGGTLSMTNVLFRDQQKGWAVGNEAGVIEAVNCTFTGIAGASETRKEVAYSQYSGSASFKNCIFWDATDGIFFVRDGDDPSFSDCTDLETDPLFVDAVYCHPKSRGGSYKDGWFSGGSWSTDDETSSTIDAAAGFAALATEPQPNGRHVNLGYDGNTEVASKSDLGTNPVVSDDALQIFSYSDRSVSSATFVTVYGDVAATGGGATADVVLAYDNEDHGTSLESWPAEKRIACGAHEPWDLVSATIQGASGIVSFRFFAANGSGETACTDPVRSFAMADRPVVDYATPFVTCYHTSVRLRLELVSNDGLDSTVAVSYWPAENPAAVQKVYANGGAKAVALGPVFILLENLEQGVEYVCQAEAESLMGVRTAEERRFTTMSPTDRMTLCVAPEAQGLGDGTDWENATTLKTAIGQATGLGDVLRLMQGAYSLSDVIAITNRPGLAIEGGYAGDGETRGALTRLVRDMSKKGFRIMDIQSSTVTVSCVSFEQGFQSVSGSKGHGVQADGSSVVFTNCVFRENGGTPGSDYWTLHGGAIGAQDGTLTVVDCTFTDNCLKYNNHLTSYGGAIYAKNASVSLIRSEFVKNYAGDNWDNPLYGGAVALQYCADAVIDGCTFRTNHVKRYTCSAGSVRGGTMWLDHCTNAVIRNCEVHGGYAGYGSAPKDRYVPNGNGFRFDSSVVSLMNTAFYGVGTGGSCGFGVVDAVGGTLGMTNVLMTGTVNAWGVGNEGGRIDVANCTFAGISTNTGDIVYAAYVQHGANGTASFRNCILWDVPCGAAYKTAGDDPAFARCAAEYAIEGSKNLLLTASPFTDAEAGDYTLFNGSPCVGAGNAKGITVPTDLAGNPRVIGRIDLGPYESPYTKGFQVIVK